MVEREVARIRSQFDLLQKTLEGSLGDNVAEMWLNIRGRLLGLGFMSEFIAILARERSRAPQMIQLVSDVLVDNGSQLDAERLKLKMERGEIIEADPLALSVVISNAVTGFFLAKMYFGTVNDKIDDDAFIETLVTMLVRK